MACATALRSPPLFATSPLTLMNASYSSANERSWADSTTRSRSRSSDVTNLSPLATVCFRSYSGGTSLRFGFETSM